MQTSLFKRMMEPHYYAAVVDHNGDGGIVEIKLPASGHALCRAL